MFTASWTFRETFFFFLILLQLICNVLSISAVQQSDPVIHTYIYTHTHIHTHTHTHTHYFSHIIPHHVPSQVIRYRLLCYTAGSHCLSTANAIVYVYKPQAPNPSRKPSPPWQPQSVLHVISLFLFCR